MLNRVTLDRIDALIDHYRELAARHPEALEQIALAEAAEAVQQSNAIENSTLTLDDTERILDGRLPSGRHDLRVDSAPLSGGLSRDPRCHASPSVMAAMGSLSRSG